MAVLGGAGSLVYDVVDFRDAGVDSVQLRVQAASATTVELHLDTADGPPIGSCPIDATGRAWATVSCPLAHTSGVHTLTLAFAGAANLNWLQFQRATD